MGYVSTGMGDHLSALLMSLIALRLALVDRNPFWPCFSYTTHIFTWGKSCLFFAVPALFRQDQSYMSSKSLKFINVCVLHSLVKMEQGCKKLTWINGCYDILLWLWLHQLLVMYHNLLG